ncbi:ribosomal protein S19 family protein, partial [Bacillus altitudinis]|uniref:ribosomal protein S19 family protein n=1 Tax=Bacillus altitudinis TaxID=293387 RepID=UPI001643EA26
MGGRLKKGGFVDDDLMAKVEQLNESDKKEVVKSWCRGCRILGELMGERMGVYEG